MWWSPWSDSFQFPSNGKAYLNASIGISGQITWLSFNSLQTGKHIWTWLNTTTWKIRYGVVSIPFKRESISERRPTHWGSWRLGDWVSIPFKRESISEHYRTGPHGHSRVFVSIPFKRESISERSNSRCRTSSGNVSIPFKRESISERSIAGKFHKNSVVFQFPSNGKAYLNVTMSSLTMLVAGISFNSLQTGKHIWTLYQLAEEYDGKEFQFPSNGKAYLNGKSANNSLTLLSFNSLQTGKHIWTCHPKERCLIGQFEAFQFPSNGKAYLNSPYFEPSGAVAPKRQNQTRSAQGFF